MTVAVLLIGFIWLYQLPIVKAEDQRSGLQQAADAAALAGAQQVAKDLPSVLLESIRHGGVPACGLGQSAAQQFAHRNAAELISYCYYPSSDRVKVTIRSLAVLESGSREEAEATASVGRRLGACELIGPSPTPSPSPSDGAGGDDPEPTKLKYRCGEFVVPVTDTNGLIELIGSEAKLLASFGLTPGLVS